MRVIRLLIFLAATSAAAEEFKVDEARFGASSWAARLGRLSRNLAKRVEFRSDGRGTETVLLVKGGVGADVDLRQDLLSTKNIFKKPLHHIVKAGNQMRNPAPAAPAQSSVDEELASVSSASDAARGLADNLKKTVKLAERLKLEYGKVQKDNTALKEKVAKEEKDLKESQAKVTSEKNEAAKLKDEKKALERKVESLEDDLLVTNKAWKDKAEAVEKLFENEEVKAGDLKRATKTRKDVAKTEKKVAKEQKKKAVKKTSKSTVAPAARDQKKQMEAKAKQEVLKATTKLSQGLKAAMAKAAAKVVSSWDKKSVSQPKKVVAAPKPPTDHVLVSGSNSDLDDDDDDTKEESTDTDEDDADDEDDDQDDSDQQ